MLPIVVASEILERHVPSRAARQRQEKHLHSRVFPELLDDAVPMSLRHFSVEPLISDAGSL